MDPIDDTGFVIATATIQVIFALEVEVNDSTMMVGCSKFFERQIKLYAPDLCLLDGLLIGKAQCLFAQTIEPFLAEAIIGAHVVIGTLGKVQLLVPAFGFCPPGESCEEPYTLETPQLKLYPEDQTIECLYVNKFFDQCSLKLCQATECPLPHDTPVHGLHTLCPMPMARSRGFWGTGRGGIRRLIIDGVVDLENYVNTVLIPIVGPGGLSPFLNTFYDPNLFIPQPNIQGIYDRTIELYESPIVGRTFLQLAIQLLTTWQNVTATEVQLLPTAIVCLQADATFAMAEVQIIDLGQCEFEVDFESFQLIETLLEKTEDILEECCPNPPADCELTMAQISDLIQVFDMINNNHVFIMMP